MPTAPMIVAFIVPKGNMKCNPAKSMQIQSTNQEMNAHFLYCAKVFLVSAKQSAREDARPATAADGTECRPYHIRCGPA